MEYEFGGFFKYGTNPQGLEYQFSVLGSKKIAISSKPWCHLGPKISGSWMFFLPPFVTK